MLHALKVWNCLNFIRKRVFFCLIKLLFIKVRCLILILALRLILKDNGGKQHSLPFVGSNLGVEIFLRWTIKKGCVEIEYWGMPVYFVLRFQQNYMQSLSAFEGILKALFFFIPWLLNFSDLHYYGLKSRKRYTLRLLSKCLRRYIPSLFGGESISLDEMLLG